MDNENSLDVTETLDLNDITDLDDFINNFEQELFSKDSSLLFEDDILSQLDDCPPARPQKDKWDDCSGNKLRKESPVLPMDLDPQHNITENVLLHDPMFIVSSQGSPKISHENRQPKNVSTDKIVKTNTVLQNNLKAPVVIPPNAFLVPPQNLVYGSIKAIAPQPQQHITQVGTQFSSNLPYRHEPPIIKRNKTSIEKSAPNRYVTLQSMGHIHVPNDQVKQMILQAQLVTNSPATVMYTTTENLQEKITVQTPPSNVITTSVQPKNNKIFTSVPLVIEPEKASPDKLKPAVKEKVPKVKEVKRNMHNAIERRYRTSINDRIIELKDIIAGPSAKMNKSLILRKAIEYIKYLQDANKKLKEENYNLNNKIDRFRSLMSEEIGDITPPRSEISSPPHSNPPTPLDGVYKHNPSTKDDHEPVHGKFDQTRVILCSFMLSIIVFNPFKLLLNKIYTPPSYTESIMEKRGLLESVEGGSEYDYGSSMLICFLNLLMFFGCFIKLLFHSESVLLTKSKSSVSYWRHRKQADLYMEKGNIPGAKHELQFCLSILRHPLPKSKVGLLLSCIWQSARQFLHRLWIGRWLSKYEHRLLTFRENKKEVLIYSKETALAYHHLQRLNIVENGDFVLGLYLSLSAINRGEAAGCYMSKDVLSDIYLGLALQLKESSISFVKLLSRFYFLLGRNENKDLNSNSHWILSVDGQNFTLNNHWNYSTTESVFTEQTDYTCPLAFTCMVFRENLIEALLQSLIAPGSQINISGIDPSASQQSLLNLLMENVTFKGRKDCRAKWWANALRIAILWDSEQDTSAEALYHHVEAIPPDLLNHSIASAVLSAIQTRQISLTPENYRLALSYASISSHHLFDSITSSPNPDKKILYVQLLVCDWLLETRTSIWESGKVSITSSFLADFNVDLNCLRRITHFLPDGTARVFIYEAVGRLIAGASPSKTLNLLDQSLRHRPMKSSIICGKEKSPDGWNKEKEHAAALYLACRHLPPSVLSSPGERAGMLVEAAKYLEKIGDKKRLINCYKLMKSIGTSALSN